MKKLIAPLLSLLLLTGCNDPPSTPAPIATVTTNTATLPTPPLPPGMQFAPAKMMTAAPLVMATSIQPPITPYMARTTSIEITNQPIFRLTAKYNAQVYGFGIAYSDDLTNWITAGESRWTNSAINNPFLEPGTTEHRIWIGEPQWQIVHRPDFHTNRWIIVLTDYTAKQKDRFYKIYPLEAVNGLPYP